MLPLLTPAVVFVSVYEFIKNWNSMLWPLVVIGSDELKTFPVAIMQFHTVNYVLYNLISCVAVIAIIPPIVLFILTRKYYRRMMWAGLAGA